MVEINSRFFSFGCSFTQYYWPTWADIIGKQFSHSENWGRSGAGNQYIFNALVECNITNQIKPTDVVGIMWTNVTRYDFYKDQSWVTSGNNINFQKYRQYDLRGLYIRDLALIYAAEQLLKSIGCRYFITSMVDMSNHDQYSVADSRMFINDLLDYYRPTLESIKPSVHQIIFNYEWASRTFGENYNDLKDHYVNVSGPEWPTFEQFINNQFDHFPEEIVTEIKDDSRWGWKDKLTRAKRIDFHPTPMEHLEYIDKILPEYSPNFETRNWCMDIEKTLRSQGYENLWKPVIIDRW